MEITPDASNGSVELRSEIGSWGKLEGTSERNEMVIKEGDFRNGEGERAAFLFVLFAEMERIKRRAVYLGEREKEDEKFLYENQISKSR